MKLKIYIMKSSKFFILVSFILLAFSIGDKKSEYLIPTAADSIFSADIDLDNDIDIITGHYYVSQTGWGGGVFLKNDGNGYFEINDSIFFDCGLAPINGNFFDNNDFIDVYGRNVTINPHKENVAIIYNYGLSQFDSIRIFNIYNGSNGIENYSSGDVDNDGDNDIVFSCNIDFFWGIIYNDGTGNFSSPEYHSLDIPPLDIACNDLNSDGRADVVMANYNVEVFFSYETGFEQQLLGYTLPWSSLFSNETIDFDNDGDLDIILGATSYNNHSDVYMYENLGNGQFYEHPYFEFTPFCSYSVISDFNNDSLPDFVFIADDDIGLFLYRNISNFQVEFDQFIPTDEGAFLQKLTYNDFDNNGYNDIALIKDYWGVVPSVIEIFFNNEMGGFQENPITNCKKVFDRSDSLFCFPNPLEQETNFQIELKETAHVELTIYNLQGSRIINLVKNKLEGGIHKIKWDGVDQDNHICNPGPYFAYLAVNGKIHSVIKLLKI
jgi:hypothetical protein